MVVNAEDYASTTGTEYRSTSVSWGTFPSVLTQSQHYNLFRHDSCLQSICIPKHLTEHFTCSAFKTLKKKKYHKALSFCLKNSNNIFTFIMDTYKIHL